MPSSYTVVQVQMHGQQIPVEFDGDNASTDEGGALTITRKDEGVIGQAASGSWLSWQAIVVNIEDDEEDEGYDEFDDGTPIQDEADNGD